MNLRVALVTYNWPPRNAIGTHRPYGWAKYWSRLGVEVTVLTSKKKPFDEPLDSELQVLPGVKVIEVDYRSVLLGSGVVERGVRDKHFFAVLKGINRFVRSKFGLVLDPRDKWAESARDVAASVAKNVDVVVSTFGPRSSHLIASRMKRQEPSLLWAADYRDLWSNSHMGDYGMIAKGTQRLKERSIVSRADFLTTVSDELASDLRSLMGKPTYTVSNGFDTEEYTCKRVREASRRRLVYTGMIYPGSRDPSPLFRALSKLLERNELQRGQLTVEFYGPYNPWLENLVESHGLSEIVKICERVSRLEAISVQCSSDALLLLESSEVSANGVVTGKLFEYLAARRPILSLGSGPHSAIARVLKECGVGICAGGDVDLICDVLRALLRGTKLTWYQPVEKEISAYSRARQAELMLHLVRDHLAIASKGEVTTQPHIRGGEK